MGDYAYASVEIGSTPEPEMQAAIAETLTQCFDGSNEIEAAEVVAGAFWSVDEIGLMFVEEATSALGALRGGRLSWSPTAPPEIDETWWTWTVNRTSPIWGSQYPRMQWYRPREMPTVQAVLDLIAEREVLVTDEERWRFEAGLWTYEAPDQGELPAFHMSQEPKYEYNGTTAIYVPGVGYWEGYTTSDGEVVVDHDLLIENIDSGVVTDVRRWLADATGYEVRKAWAEVGKET